MPAKKKSTSRVKKNAGRKKTTTGKVKKNSRKKTTERVRTSEIPMSVLKRVSKLRKQGMTWPAIREEVGYKSTQLRPALDAAGISYESGEGGTKKKSSGKKTSAKKVTKKTTKRKSAERPAKRTGKKTAAKKTAKKGTKKRRAKSDDKEEV